MTSIIARSSLISSWVIALTRPTTMQFKLPQRGADRTPESRLGRKADEIIRENRLFIATRLRRTLITEVLRPSITDHQVDRID
jgi:hypothetical protein